LAGLFVLRVRSALGDEGAAVDLAAAAATRAMPGLAAVQAG
jgi:hypothetical protein